MNTWTDILLIVAIVIGLIAAASLPMVSVNAISPDALRLREGRRDIPPWVLTADDAKRRRVSALQEATVLHTPHRATLSAALMDPAPSATTLTH